MKKQNLALRALTAALLLTTALTAFAGCQSDPDGAPDTDGATKVEDTTKAEETTAVPEQAWTVDGRYRIVISVEADVMTRETADMVAAALKDKVGLELPIVTDEEAATEHELVLGPTARMETQRPKDYALSIHGESIYLEADNSSALYYAAEAVLSAWLTADFGLTQEGAVTLKESRVADLNGLSHTLTNSIKVMTQNTRDADDPDGNSMAKRFDRFCLLLADYQPDIIGTQEHSYTWYVLFEKTFKKMKGDEGFPHYTVVGDSMNGPDAKGGSRNAILFRTDRFDLVETDTFWLSDTPEVPSAIGHGAHKRNCTWVLLKDKETERNVLAVNTHLDHTSEDLRLQQIAVIMEYLAQNVGDYPVFFTGDFNTTSRSQTYGVVTEAFSDARTTARKDLSTVSGTYHGYSDGGRGAVIDHVFHNDKAEPITYEIVSKSFGGFVSDHYGVLVEFAVK